MQVELSQTEVSSIIAALQDANELLAEKIECGRKYPGDYDQGDIHEMEETQKENMRLIDKLGGGNA